MAKDSFILYIEHKDVFNILNDEEAGKLIKAIFEYEETGQIIELDKSLKIAFIPIKNALDRNKEKYKNVVERNKKNIEKRWNKNNTKNTIGINGKDENTKNTDNDNDNDNDSDNDNDNDNDSDNDNDNQKQQKQIKRANVSTLLNENVAVVVDFYNNNIGMITGYGLEVLTSYLDDGMETEVIIFAMKQAIEQR